jgi:hypothetical protein
MCSPTYVNAECSQDNYRAYKEHGNHSSVEDNLPMVEKTLVKEVARGCALTLDPAVMDFLENIKQMPHGILNLDHPTKKTRVICDSSNRPHEWCVAINDITNKKNKPKLEFASSFVVTLQWIWNLRISYTSSEIYVCDDDASMAFRQIKYPPNLAGMHCSAINGTLFLNTGQTFGDCTSPPNWELVAICRSEHAQASGIAMIHARRPSLIFPGSTMVRILPLPRLKCLSRQIETPRIQGSLMKRVSAGLFRTGTMSTTIYTPTSLSF